MYLFICVCSLNIVESFFSPLCRLTLLATSALREKKDEDCLSASLPQKGPATMQQEMIDRC